MNVQQWAWLGEKVKQIENQTNVAHFSTVVPASHMTKRVVVAIEGVMFAVTMVCQHLEQYVIQIYTDCNFSFLSYDDEWNLFHSNIWFVMEIKS